MPTDSAGQGLPISALLSQALVALTIELDNEFERQMGELGHAGARLSLVVWSNLFRFIPEGGISVSELAALAFGQQERVKLMVGCLERWGFLVVGPSVTGSVRDGWGGGRGIRAESVVRATPKGLQAREVWLPLVAVMEQRWETRFGKDAMRSLRESLELIVGRLDVELPDAVPEPSLREETVMPRVRAAGESRRPLATLLSRALFGFAIEFDRESEVPLALAANTLRVLGREPVSLADVPRLTGGSPEVSAIGWRLKPYVIVETDPRRRRKLARLSARGLQVQREYLRLVAIVEARWEVQFGKDTLRRLRGSLQGLFDRAPNGQPRVTEGLTPPAGVSRAGDQAPALGRRDVGAAARQRTRDLVTQTRAFVADPARSLPHYPLWDMNRGFGP